MLEPKDLIKKKSTLKNAKWQKTWVEVSWFNGKILPIGTEYKAFESKNFGWVILKNEIGGRKIYQL